MPLAKNEPGSEFSALAPLPSVAPDCLLYDSKPETAWNVSLCLCLSVSLTKGFALSFAEQYRSITWRK